MQARPAGNLFPELFVQLTLHSQLGTERLDRDGQSRQSLCLTFPRPCTTRRQRHRPAVTPNTPWHHEKTLRRSRLWISGFSKVLLRHVPDACQHSRLVSSLSVRLSARLSVAMNWPIGCEPNSGTSSTVSTIEFLRTSKTETAGLLARVHLANRDMNDVQT